MPGLSLDSPLQKFIWALMTWPPGEVRTAGLRERDFRLQQISFSSLKWGVIKS